MLFMHWVLQIGQQVGKHHPMVENHWPLQGQTFLFSLDILKQICAPKANVCTGSVTYIFTQKLALLHPPPQLQYMQLPQGVRAEPPLGEEPKALRSGNRTLRWAGSVGAGCTTHMALL